MWSGSHGAGGQPPGWHAAAPVVYVTGGEGREDGCNENMSGVGCCSKITLP